MIIVLKGADFSQSNVGTLSTWRITRSLGAGATYEGPISIDKGAALNATVTLATNYEVSSAGVTITMGGTVLDDAYSISGNIITIAIANVTNNVLIKVPTVNISTGDEGSDTPNTIITDLSGYERHQGFISSTNTWNNINEKYQHVVVPVSGYTTLEITTSADNHLYFAGLQTYTAPVNGAALAFSDNTEWAGRMSCPKATTRSWIVPKDVRYLVFWVISNTIDATPDSISIVTGG